eukprot:Skav226887  [mRNA]  locus=scaffold1187:470623:473202:+ [translate_table: standard]
MMSLPLVFALLSLSLADGDIKLLQANNLSEVPKPAKKADGLSDFSNRLNENLVMKRAEEETSRAWNALWNNSWVRNAVNQTETDTAYTWKMAENNTVLRPVVQEVAHTYSQLTNVTSANATVPDVEHMETHGWNVGALLCVAILLLCPAGCCAYCAWINCRYFPWSCKQGYDQLPQSREVSRIESVVSATSNGSSEASSDTEANVSAAHHLVSKLWSFEDRKLGEVLRQEVLLMLMCPVLALLAAPWTTCEAGSPSWLYLVYLPVLARSKWVELQLMLSRQVQSEYRQALACDLNGFQITERWASAWDGSSAGWFVPVVQTFHVPVSGLAFLAFCLGAGTQQVLGAMASTSAEILADLASMHGLAELSGRTSDNPDEAKRNRLVFVGVCKVALENIPQLLLQSSFLALVFDRLTPLGRTKVLFSILLGLLSASQKILEAIRELVTAICQVGAEWNYVQWLFASVFSVFFMLAVVAVLWTVIKLYFVFHCETHLWNLGSGCVEWT